LTKKNPTPPPNTPNPNPKRQGQALKPNPFAWNIGLANLLFLESPAFVGFSYSERPSDAIVGARPSSHARADGVR